MQSTYTDADFESLSWHDCSLYGVALEGFDDPPPGRLLIDLDFIVAWPCVGQGEEPVFQVAPGTMIFSNAWDISFAIDHPHGLWFPVETFNRIPIDVPSGVDGFFRWEFLGPSTGLTQAVV